MYDELVKRLRNCATQAAPCKTCGLIEDSSCSDTLMKQAADAIEDTSKAYQMMAEAYEAEVTKPRWIPVTERLPEDLTRAIVFCEDGVSFGLCVHLIADDTEVVEWHDFFHYPITPTHWMPLPEPPKEE